MNPIYTYFSQQEGLAASCNQASYLEVGKFGRVEDWISDRRVVPCSINHVDNQLIADTLGRRLRPVYQRFFPQLMRIYRPRSSWITRSSQPFQLREIGVNRVPLLTTPLSCNIFFFRSIDIIQFYLLITHSNYFTFKILYTNILYIKKYKNIYNIVIYSSTNALHTAIASRFKNILKT